jgi:hypothetical protein
VSYTITRRPGRAGRYLCAAWAIPALPYWVGRDNATPDSDVYAVGPVVGVDLNDGHLAVRRLDAHGNPVGPAQRIDVDLSGSSARRDAHLRHAITGLIHYTRRRGILTIAVEDLDFADARSTGRETMGRGARGKRFRKTVSGIPTAVFGNRLTGMAARAGIQLFAVIGRRAQGFRARRRKGVTHPRPEDRAVRATDQAGPDNQQATTDSPNRTRTRGTTSRAPCRARTRLPGRATATPATANKGQLQT